MSDMKDRWGAKNEIVKQFYASTVQSMSDFIQYLPAVIPSDDDDAKTLSIALDMVKQLKENLEHAETIRDVGDIIDIDLLMEEWDYDQNHLIIPYSNDAHDIVKNIEEEYSRSGDDYEN